MPGAGAGAAGVPVGTWASAALFSGSDGVSGMRMVSATAHGGNDEITYS